VFEPLELLEKLAALTERAEPSLDESRYDLERVGPSEKGASLSLPSLPAG
jgi:hypothetical protein